MKFKWRNEQAWSIYRVKWSSSLEEVNGNSRYFYQQSQHFLISSLSWNTRLWKCSTIHSPDLTQCNFPHSWTENSSQELDLMAWRILKKYNGIFSQHIKRGVSGALTNEKHAGISILKTKRIISFSLMIHSLFNLNTFPTHLVHKEKKNKTLQEIATL